MKDIPTKTDLAPLQYNECFSSKQQHVGAPFCLRKRSVTLMSKVVTERYRTRNRKMV
jgi:hypothetical protein